MTWLEVNGARLWFEQQGTGPVVLFVHGGLGDLRLWEPQARALSSRFHTIRYDLRFWGRSESADSDRPQKRRSYLIVWKRDDRARA